jgi:peptidoglycan/xylan/chitin deacetylase (PgdA/CDA1 family)
MGAVGNGLADLVGSLVRPLTFLPLERTMSQFGGGFILAFHEVTGERFTEQIEAYRGLKIISLSEMIERIRTHRSAGCLAITVDDGIGSTVQAVSIVARERNWPVTFYLPTQYLDEPASSIHMIWTNISRRLPMGALKLSSGTYDLSNLARRAKFVEEMLQKIYGAPILSYGSEIFEIRDRLVAMGLANIEDLNPPAPVAWNQVSAYSKNELLDFQSHGVSHEALSVMNVADLEAELKSSQRKIEEATGRPCRHFCYPFGGKISIGSASPKLVSKYYDSAVTMNRGRVKGNDLMLLPRIPIYTKDSASLARLKVLTI